MTGARDREEEQRPAIRADLVEYMVVTAADVDGLGAVGDELAALSAAGTVRILDLVVVVRSAAGSVSVSEVDAVPGLADLVGPADRRDLLSERDIELASRALVPGSAGVIVVTEDRWAEPLSTAARRAGGQIAAGDRIPPGRVELALASPTDDTVEG
jgi:hypothetical protein